MVVPIGRPCFFFDCLLASRVVGECYGRVLMLVSAREIPWPLSSDRVTGTPVRALYCMFSVLSDRRGLSFLVLGGLGCGEGVKVVVE